MCVIWSVADACGQPVAIPPFPPSSISITHPHRYTHTNDPLPPAIGRIWVGWGAHDKLCTIQVDTRAQTHMHTYAHTHSHTNVDITIGSIARGDAPEMCDCFERSALGALVCECESKSVLSSSRRGDRLEMRNGTKILFLSVWCCQTRAHLPSPASRCAVERGAFAFG